ncbi:MAG: FAD-dependent oxidoreductase [Chitinispirillaceae bacterium]|nr:FAD-dependent oxidoreductase [Chitinispirillaceae bacterium]
MPDFRIKKHPILTVPKSELGIPFSWQGKKLFARQGETIASALFAHGIRIFGRHHKDGAPMGIFCANGQCSQCTVLVNGQSVKSCMTLVKEGMEIEPLEGIAALPEAVPVHPFHPIDTVETECLIIGGGPAGLCAAIELGKAGVNTILIDDKHCLGGKLILQTHKFFGSIEACHAGTRGMDIAAMLEKEVRSSGPIRVWTQSQALGVFVDRTVGILRDNRYILVRPHILLVAAGAREKSLVFKGNSLPGVFGAGAFQTLVNRDLVLPSRKLFVVGGGNVGLIAAYHALQAGMQVVGLCEALPECGGYKVHRDKIVRMGVPVYTSHSIASANGRNEVESVTIVRLGPGWKPVPGSEKTFSCDTVLVAVGLDPVDEFYQKAKEFGLPAYAAGDTEEIAEASAAMLTGRIRGMEIAAALGRPVGTVPPAWHKTADILKSRPGAVALEEVPPAEHGVFPVFHCSQEIPCNPCSSICPKGCIAIEGDDITGLPVFRPGAGDACSGCGQCVAICPGLAITLCDYRKARERGSVLVSIPHEFSGDAITAGTLVTVLDTTGTVLGNVTVDSVRTVKKVLIVKVQAPFPIAKRIAGIRVQEPWVTEPLEHKTQRFDDDEIVCRCERVTAGSVRALIRSGARDMNQIKAHLRAGMGSCGGKTCANLIRQIFREEGVKPEEVTGFTRRPLFVEVPLGILAGLSKPPDASDDHASERAPGSLQGEV